MNSSGLNEKKFTPNLIYKTLCKNFMRIQAETVASRVVDSKGKVVVGGGTGFIGTELRKQLDRKGYEVVVLSRNKEPFNLTWKEIEHSGLPQNTKAVVNLAGHNVLDMWHRWTPKFKQLVYDSRIETAKTICQAIQKTPKSDRPEVFVQISGIGYYPPLKDVIQDEKSPGGNHDFLAKLVVDWEDAARLPDNFEKTRNVFIRSGVVLGRNGGLINQVFLPFFMGTGGRMGSGDQPMPWIHVKDISRLIIHSIENKSVKGVINGVSPDIVTNQEFVTSFAAALGRPAIFPIPEFVWKMIFGEERADMIIKGQKVMPNKVLESGFKFRYEKISDACREFSSFFYSDSDESQ